jgi:hypothetical protein
MMLNELEVNTAELDWLDARAIASALTGEQRSDQLDRITQALLREGDCDE